MTPEEFKRKAIHKHAGKYTYSEVTTDTTEDKVCITCPIHGNFWQKPSSHLFGRGCPECAKISRKAEKNKKTQKRFILSAKLKFKGKYDYLLESWVDRHHDLTILCPVHGEFKQKPTYHLSKGCKGCPCCHEEKVNEEKLSQFIRSANAVHKGKYLYSSFQFDSMETLSTIDCPEHGPFEQTAKRHLKGQGCPKCGSISSAIARRTGTAEFVRRAALVHKGKYNYDNVEYLTTDHKVSITCPTHGNFKQKASLHLRGHGCPKCGTKKGTAKQTKPYEKFISLANGVHNHRYTYSKEKYTAVSHKVGIICRSHGEFYQTGTDHLNGVGCPKCGALAMAEKRLSNSSEFARKATQVHEGKYSYDKVKYFGSKKSVTLVCPDHGEFEQIPNDHLDGHGCQSCANLHSSLETKLVEALSPNFPDLIQGDRSGIAGGGKRNLEVDILLPNQGIAIEVSGLYWHSSAQEKHRGRDWVINHQNNKRLACANNGIQLITLYEDEIENKLDIVVKSIENKANISRSAIYARKTTVVDISWSQASAFLETNHIQGPCQPAKAKGLVIKEKYLVAVMVFDKVRSVRGAKKEGEYELIRYASESRVQGGASKLLNAFLKAAPKCNKVISYADKRVSDGGLYSALGFRLLGETKPDYFYTKGGKRYHKSGFRKRSLPNKLANFDSRLTEEQNCFNHGYFKIFNCGLQKWGLDV